MRIRRSVASRKRRKRLIRHAKGYWGRRKNLIRRVHETVMRAWAFAYRDRRQRKRDFRRLWITRINAAVRPHGLSYSRFIAALTSAGVEINRKTLSELAIREPKMFEAVVETAKKQMQ